MELQKRRQLVNSKIEMLNREQELLRKIAADKKKETEIKAGLAEFAALVASNLKRISFENKQKLLRIVLDKVVVNEWRVDVYYNIPLPKPTPTPEERVSTQFDLRSACTPLRPMTFRTAADAPPHVPVASTDEEYLTRMFVLTRNESVGRLPTGRRLTNV